MKTLKSIYTGAIYADEDVLASAPKNKRVGELEFFNLGKFATCAEVEAEYLKRGLAPAEVLSLAGWAEEHKDDPREYFATQWKDKDGNFCYAAFYRWLGKRFVYVYRYDDDWYGPWWFSGVRLVPQVLGTEKVGATHSDSLPLFLSELKALIEKYENP